MDGDHSNAVIAAIGAAVRVALTQGAGDAAAATLKSVTVDFADDGSADVTLDGATYPASADEITAALGRGSMPPPPPST